MNAFSQAGRRLRRRPLFFLSVAGVLGIGVGSALAISVLAERVLLQSLPYNDAERLSFVYRREFQQKRLGLSLREYNQVGEHSGLAVAAFQLLGSAGVLGDWRTQPVRIAAISENFLELLGTRPLLGGFTGTKQAGEIEALVSFAVWRDRFGASPKVLGGVVRSELSNRVFRVAGVLPVDFVFPDSSGSVGILVPLSSVLDEAALSHRVTTWIARRSEGMSEDVLAQRLHSSLSDRPATSVETLAVAVEPLRHILFAQKRVFFMALLSSGVILLILACVNAAFLIAHEIRERTTEIATQFALGASRWSISYVFIAEVALTACVGSILGALFASLILGVSAPLLTQQGDWIPRSVFGSYAMALLVGIALASTVIVGALATVRLPRVDVVNALRGARLGNQGRTPGYAFLTLQVALAFFLAVSAASSATSLRRLWNQDLGFKYQDLFQLEVSLGSGRRDELRTRGLQVLQRLQASLEPKNVALVAAPFLSGGFLGSPFGLPRGAVPRGMTNALPVTGHYFEVMSMTAVAGRLPRVDEWDAASPVVVVSRSVAETYWPGQSAIGKTLFASSGPSTVIGVVEDAKYVGLDKGSQGEIYLPFEESPRMLATAIVRPRPLMRPDDLGQLVQDLGAPIAVQNVAPMSARVAKTIDDRRLLNSLSLAFALAAIAITCSGLYAMSASIIRSRRKELAIRLALGARRRHILRLIVLKQIGVVALGIAIGTLLTAWGNQFVKAFLFEMTAFDVQVWLISSVVVSATSILASAAPFAFERRRALGTELAA